jgi:xylulokinase
MKSAKPNNRFDLAGGDAMSVIGLDLGTTACKAIALNADGKVIAYSMQEYDVAENEKGFVELNPQDVWESVRSVLRGVAGQTENDPIQAISISAMGDTVTPFDESLRPLSNSILAFDTRSQAEAEILGKQLGDEWLFNTTGMPLHAMYTACKILWLKRNSPEVFSKTKKFLCYEDYIVAKLGAVPSISFSNAARTMIFDGLLMCVGRRSDLDKFRCHFL